MSFMIPLTAKLDEGIIQCFMGHSTSTSGTYLSKDPSWLLGQYLRMQDFVTIFLSPSEREDVKKLKQSLEAARLERDELRAKVKKQAERMTITEDDAKAKRDRAQFADNSGLGGGVFLKRWGELSDEEKFMYKRRALMRKMLDECCCGSRASHFASGFCEFGRENSLRLKFRLFNPVYSVLKSRHELKQAGIGKEELSRIWKAVMGNEYELPEL